MIVAIGLAVVVVLVAAALGATSRRLAAARAEAAKAEAAATAVAAERDAAAKALVEREREAAAQVETIAGREAELAELREQLSRADVVELQARLAKAEAWDAVGWDLELRRSERHWRTSVSPGPHVVISPIASGPPLIAALSVELDAAREEIGTVTDLVVDLDAEPDASMSLMALRVVQEFVADLARRSETVTVHVSRESDEVVIGVDARDEFGEPVLPITDGLTAPGLTLTDDGIRIGDAVLAPTPELDRAEELLKDEALGGDPDAQLDGGCESDGAEGAEASESVSDSVSELTEQGSGPAGEADVAELDGDVDAQLDGDSTVEPAG